MSQSPLHFMLVGAGRIAQSYIDVLANVPALKLVAVVDPVESAAKATAGAANAAPFQTVADALAAIRIDAALVCSPPITHGPVCEALLAARVAVLCEKPLCITSQEAHKLIALANKQQTLFTMATKFRFVDDVVEAKRRVDAGQVGKVLSFKNAFTARVDMARRWNSDPAISGGGVLIDNGTHSVDLVRYFLGPIDKVQAVEGPRWQPLDVEDTVQMFVSTASGALCSIDLSWSLDKMLSNYVSICGSEGMLRVGWKGCSLHRYGSPTPEAFGNGYSKNAAFTNQLRDFAGAALGQHAPRVSTDEALASVQVIEAAYRSIRANTWQDIHTQAHAE